MSWVIITMPPSITAGMQIAVATAKDAGEVAVNVRAHPRETWVPLTHIDGKYEVRP